MKPIKFPELLIIHIKRFEEFNQTYRKIKKPIEYPLEISMDEYCNKPWARLGKFNLIGLVSHKGKTLESGHYVAFTKRQDGIWYNCNDDTVTRVQKVEQILEQKNQAYILLYQVE
mmetsp:Transcript_26156/g.25335  ORF Transcript_26156/g.25335 Transcript_26156/m.25335 type:complete len:115 (+) Transcript_26156:1698-2042(+)